MGDRGQAKNSDSGDPKPANSASGDYKRWEILTDLHDLEESLGDMILSVAGTREGVMAVQMKVESGGIPLEVFSAGLKRARQARGTLLNAMATSLPKVGLIELLWGSA